MESVTDTIKQTDEISDNKKIVPIAVVDISYWFYLEIKGKKLYSVGSKEVDRYFRIDENNLYGIMNAIALMDGSLTINEIEKELLNTKRIKIDVEMLYNKLKKNGLIQNSDSNNTASEVDTMGVKLIWHKFKPMSLTTSRFLTVVCNIIAILFAVAVLGAIASTFIRFEAVKNMVNHGFSYNGSYIVGMLIAIIISFVSLFFHELSHALTSVRFGLQPSEFRVFLYGGISPYWLIKIKGMYTVDRKSRVSIMAAGVFTNLSLMAITIMIIVWMPVSENTVEILSKVLITNFYIITGCISPFFLSDGYFIMTQVLKISNLRMRAIKLLGRKIKGDKEKSEPVIHIYMLISIALFGISMIYTIIWCYNIAIEIRDLIPIPYLNYVGMSVPFIFTGITLFLFVKRFSKLIVRGE